MVRKTDKSELSKLVKDLEKLKKISILKQKTLENLFMTC